MELNHFFLGLYFKKRFMFSFVIAVQIMDDLVTPIKVELSKAKERISH